MPSAGLIIGITAVVIVCGEQQPLRSSACPAGMLEARTSSISRAGQRTVVQYVLSGSVPRSHSDD